LIVYAGRSISHSCPLTFSDRFSIQTGDRSTTASIVIKPRQYKQIINLFRWGFTFLVELLLDIAGKWLKSFLALFAAAHRGYEGSGGGVQKHPKDLDTLVIVLAQAKAVERQDYRKQFNCLACAYIQANAIVQQLFNFCKVIALPLCRRELSVHPVNLSEG
jgi:hypothetical protein